jgi:beta-glucosidase
MPDIPELISQMTLTEKAALCIGLTAWSTTPVERLGIPSMMVTDGPHGVRRTADETALLSTSLPATCFPTAACLAASWDLDLVHAVGQAIAEEAIALQVDLILGPGTNMKRTPLCGRNFEYFSEDPFLAGEMAASLINGVQSKGVGTSLKHFAANNQEWQRSTISSELDERTLREIYLPAFEIAVKKGHPWTVMCSYNKLNGTFASENHFLLTEILKDEWAFQGFVVSDWGAVHNRLAALQAGLDLEMPGPRERRVKELVDAVRSGQLDEALLDEAARRILQIVFKAAATPKGGSFDIPAHHALARRVAADGMVLLKNNGLLPLSAQQHLAVIGLAAKDPQFQGGGSSHINATRTDIPFDELQKALTDATLTYAPGSTLNDDFDQALIDEAVTQAKSADVALLYLALPPIKVTEGYDRPDLDLGVQQLALIKAVTSVQPNTVIILNTTSAVVMSEWIGDTAAVLVAWMMGQAGGGAIADVLTGQVNPSGKLAETFPLRLVDTPAYLNYPGENGAVRYGEGIFIGYRYYDAKDVPVLFPFGHGLSYTTFEYSNLRFSSPEFTDVDGLTVSVDVTNTGKVAGKEIVQFYVHDQHARLVRPPKELKGFAKVGLLPGETKTVTVDLDMRAFAYYHPSYRQWIAEPGEFDILVGASAADIRAQATVTLQSTVRLPCILDRASTLREWLDDPLGQQVPLIQQMISQMRTMFAGAEELGLDPLGFMMDMPLVDMLNFQGDALPAAPDQIVDGLLAQVRGS